MVSRGITKAQTTFLNMSERREKEKKLLSARDDVTVEIFLHFLRRTTQYQREEMKIEAYLVRLCVVQLLPVIPDFFRPFANGSLQIKDENI